MYIWVEEKFLELIYVFVHYNSQVTDFVTVMIIHYYPAILELVYARELCIPLYYTTDR